MAWTFLPSSAHFFRFKNWCKITSQKKSSFTSARCCAEQVVKLTFLSKKCIFRAENNFLLSQKKLVFFTILNLPIAIPKIVESPAIVNHCSKIQDKIKLRKSEHSNVNVWTPCNHAVPSHRRQSRVKQSSVWWRTMSAQHTNGTSNGQGDKK